MGAPLRSETLTRKPRGFCTDPVRVMIVDDSLTVRTVFSRMIKQEHDMVIVGTANTAEAGLSDLPGAAPDVMMLDLEMPGMGGLEALPKIMEIAPKTKVLVISSLTADGAESTVKALSLGAADTMLKPRPGGFDDDYKAGLLGKIRALKGLPPEETEQAAPSSANVPQVGKPPQAIAIGASTGGIHALNLFLRQVPQNFDLPILVTQHLPASFIPVFAQQMEMAGNRPAVLADEGTVIERGKIYIAPGHGHMVVRKA
ncbi:MAG: chemotaxis protein CheB, partial [Pseudomonadota bacterium]|nr:chemotaxis protein CheB [Pseudomonadota bacterium]